MRDTGVVFDALTERDGQLADLIANSNRVFETTAVAQRGARRDLPRSCPTFIDEGRVTTDRLTAVRRGHRPADHPAAPGRARAVADADPAARPRARPEGPVPRPRPADHGLRAGPAGGRAVPRGHASRCSRQVDPFLRELNPILLGLGLYRRELTAFFAIDVAATQATDRPPGARGPVHYLRTANPVNPEILAAVPAPPRHQPVEPVHRAGRLRDQPAQGVRHLRSAAPRPSRRSHRPARAAPDPLPLPPACRAAGRPGAGQTSSTQRAARADQQVRLPGRQPGRPAVRGAGAARRAARPDGQVPAPRGGAGEAPETVPGRAWRGT